MEQGNNLKIADNGFEKNSRVRIVNEEKLAMLLHERAPKSVFDHHFGDIDFDDPNLPLDVISINMENLANYIGCTEYELTKQGGENYRAKLQRNLWQAMMVQKIGLHTEQEYGKPFLPMVVSPSEYGRIYYKGLNIQNVSKEVRGAIIGSHFQYDINASVFAFKLWTYGLINGGDNNLVNTKLGSYTRQYLNEKNAIRKRLAKHCYEGVGIQDEHAVKNIKLALTAIGFGARTTGASWPTKDGFKGTALSEIIGSKDARERFLSEPWVKMFLAEQKDIEEAILAAVKADDRYPAMAAIVRKDNGVNGKASNAGLMSLTYQHWERERMDEAVQVLRGFGITPIARIHDAFIVRDKLSVRVLDEINAIWGIKSYLSMDCSEVRGWIDPDFKRALDGANIDVEAHRQHLEHEQQMARMYAIKKQAGVA
jgi:hypothetical protein